MRELSAPSQAVYPFPVPVPPDGEPVQQAGVAYGIRVRKPLGPIKVINTDVCGFDVGGRAIPYELAPEVEMQDASVCSSTRTCNE